MTTMRSTFAEVPIGRIFRFVGDDPEECREQFIRIDTDYGYQRMDRAGNPVSANSTEHKPLTKMHGDSEVEIL